MLKKTLQLTCATIQEVQENLGAEKITICPICKTFCNMDEINNHNNFCIYCTKKIDQFKQIKVFTFKPCLYFFYKIGISKNDLEALEYEQMKFGIRNNFLEYNYNNMIWYVYNDVDVNILYNKVVEIFDFYKKIEFNNKTCIKNSIDKYKHTFINNKKYISIHMIVSDFSNCTLNFSNFLSRERIFV
jgi:hypothetical protein